MFSSLILAAVLHLTSNARADASLLAGSASTTETPGRTLVRHIIASGQVAVAFSLLVTAVLLVRSAWHLAKIDLGFDPRNVLTANVTLHESRYRRVEDRRRFFASLLSELQRLPNVTHASLTGWLPFRVGPATWLEPESVMIEPIRVSMRAVSPGYFDALRIHVVDGRPITADDIASRPSTAVVSRTLTRSVWGDDNSLGRKFRIRFSNERSRPGFGPFTVVGIVDDTLESLVEPTPPQIYLAFNQQPLATNAFLHVRTSASPLDLSPAVARVLGAADPELPLSEPATLESVVAREGLRPRFLSRLLTSLAGAALAITVIGLSAVSAWIAQQRQREAALRVALGATRSSVTFLVIRRGCIGLGTGLAAGWVTTNPVTTRVATELYGISATDLGTRISVAVALAVISALALWLPAWRASGRALSALLRAE
jgi:predicted permease